MRTVAQQPFGDTKLFVFLSEDVISFDVDYIRTEEKRALNPRKVPKQAMSCRSFCQERWCKLYLVQENCFILLYV